MLFMLASLCFIEVLLHLITYCYNNMFMLYYIRLDSIVHTVIITCLCFIVFDLHSMVMNLDQLLTPLKLCVTFMLYAKFMCKAYCYNNMFML